MRCFLVVVALLLAGVYIGACGNGANNVAACQQLESARCARAPFCGVELTYPLHEGNSTSDNVAACQLYYQDACLHGLVTSVGVSTTEVNNCVKAINESCPVMLAPQTSPACSFLNPPDAGVDAGVDAPVADVVTTDIVVVVTPPADAGVDSAALTECLDSCDSQCVDDPTCQMQCEESCVSG
jgi:hypothetical protein